MKPIGLPAEPDPDPFADPISVAIVDETIDWGYPNIRVEDVIRRAGVPAEEFERRFADLDHCALDTYERQIAAFERAIGGVFNQEPDWRSAIRAAAYATAEWLEEHPRPVRFGTTEVLKMPREMARVRREEVFTFCAQMIDRGREACPDPRAVPESASIVAIGSIVQLLTRRLQEGRSIQYPQATREALYGVVRTYLGEDAGREELAAPLPLQAAHC